MTRAVALAAAALVAAGCGSGSSAPRPALGGKALFVQHCGSCHSLAAAGTRGTFGADLDRSRPTEAAVLKAIADGKGTMPAGIVGGRDAELVAAYVARAARMP